MKFRQCRYCKSKLNEGAIKCVQCGNYQNWRRFVDIGNATFALIIASVSLFVSLSYGFSEAYRKYFSRKVALGFFVERIDQRGASIVIYNKGEMPVKIAPNLSCQLPILDVEGYCNRDANCKERRIPTSFDIKGVSLITFKLESAGIIEGAKYVALRGIKSEPIDVSDRTKVRPEQGFCLLGYSDLDGNKQAVSTIVDMDDFFEIDLERIQKN